MNKNLIQNYSILHLVFFLLNQRPRFKVKKLTRIKSLQGPTFITKSAEKISNYPSQSEEVEIS